LDDEFLFIRNAPVLNNSIFYEEKRDRLPEMEPVLNCWPVIRP